MGKVQNVLQPHNMTAVGNKKGCNTDVCCDTDKPRECYVIHKNNRSDDFTHVKCSVQANLYRESLLVAAWGWGQRGHMSANGCGFPLEGDEDTLQLDYADGCTTFQYTGKHPIVKLTWVNCMVCKLYQRHCFFFKKNYV